MRNRVIISIGSNQDKERNMECATVKLLQHIPSICFSPAVYTEPIECPASVPFLNRIAFAQTSLSAESLILVFKKIEKSLGRKPEDKKLGIVSIDIDLLQWNDAILKPDDMKRDYVVAGIQSLLVAMQDNERG